jgi:hypothetical protein
MGRFISFLIVVAGLVAAGILVQQYLVTEKAKLNPHISALRGLISKQSQEQELTQVEDPWFADEGRFFRILGIMHETEQDKYELDSTLLTAATGSSGVRPGEAKMIVDALMESYQLAKTLGVFADTNNLLLLDRGEAPVATARGWEDEKLSVGQRISPLLAPEAARSLVNLILMPESMRDLQGIKVTDFTTDNIKKWRAENIITPLSAEAIAEIVLPKNKF